jgi:guanosine-3',5'-bis(diphosphate) 3'-pyrophosphohydrolase
MERPRETILDGGRPESIEQGDVALSARSTLMSPRLDIALRYAAACHEGQSRRGCNVPYFEHVVAVGWILDRAGFGEDVVIAALLHDVVEDTQATLADVEERFGGVVAGLVGYCSEVKTDAQGRKRPWIDRKRDHLAALAEAPVEARAVILADKLHNLISIEVDLSEGRPVWSQFHAERDQVLWYYREAIRICGTGDPRLEDLSARGREVLVAIEAYAG